MGVGERIVEGFGNGIVKRVGNGFGKELGKGVEEKGDGNRVGDKGVTEKEVRNT